MANELSLRFDDLSSRHESLSAELDPTKKSSFLEFYVRLIPRVLDAERCSIFVYDPVQNKAWLKSGTAVKERGIEVSIEGSVVGKVISSRKAVIATDLQSRNGSHRHVDTTTGFVTREIICVPIRSSDGTRITGAIEVLNKKKGDAKFTAEDESFLEEVGQHFQGIVEAIYLGQEAIGMTRQAVADTARAERMSKIWSGVSLAFLLLFGMTFGISIVKMGKNLAGF